VERRPRELRHAYGAQQAAQARKGQLGADSVVQDLLPAPSHGHIRTHVRSNHKDGSPFDVSDPVRQSAAMPDATHPPSSLTLVVMGVSGVGKTTIARALVERTGWVFQEGDDLHPEANRAKMAAGTPLTDDDRRPWLERIAAWIGAQEAAGRGAVVTCSALRRRYRDLLRDGHPSVRFVYLQAAEKVLAERVADRHHEYMPPGLLRSQLDTLEPLEADEPGVGVETYGSPADVAARVLEALGCPDGR
jgi:gluconokinase